MILIILHFTSVFSGVRKLAILAKVSLNTNTLRGQPQLIIVFVIAGSKEFYEYIGICEYVIGVIHDKDIWYYVGEYDADGKKLEPRQKYSSFLADAKRYDDMDLLRDDLGLLHESVTRKILEIQRCPKCKKELTEYPASSRADNETEICPEYGIAEAIEVYSRRHC